MLVIVYTCQELPTSFLRRNSASPDAIQFPEQVGEMLATPAEFARPESTLIAVFLSVTHIRVLRRNIIFVLECKAQMAPLVSGKFAFARYKITLATLEALQA